VQGIQMPQLAEIFQHLRAQTKETGFFSESVARSRSIIFVKNPVSPDRAQILHSKGCNFSLK
jgi:hypothetical protein